MGWLGRRRERRLQAAEAFRAARRLAAEDVTVLGEELAGLHLETLTAVLDDAGRTDYEMALNRYDAAKAALAAATTTGAVDAVAGVLADARWARARVIARRDGLPLPERRDECFFNAQHGPAQFDVAWAPLGGVERTVAVCADDRNRLAREEEPAIRLVRAGDRYVPWYAATGGAPGYSAHVVSGASTLASQAATIQSGFYRNGIGYRS